MTLAGALAVVTVGSLMIGAWAWGVRGGRREVLNAIKACGVEFSQEQWRAFRRQLVGARIAERMDAADEARGILDPRSRRKL